MALVGCRRYLLLHDAASKGDLEKARILINRGEDVNLKDKEGYTPLHLAAYEGHFEVVKLLVENGANLNLKDKDGLTPFDVARAMGHAKIAKFLEQKTVVFVKHPPPKPHLLIYGEIEDENKDKILEGGEKFNLNMEVENQGIGKAYGVKVHVSAPFFKGFPKDVLMGDIEPKSKKSVSLEGSTPYTLKGGDYSLEIRAVDETGKHPSKPLNIMVALKPRKEKRVALIKHLPNLICEVDFNEPSGNNVLDAEEEGKLIVNVKNTGEENAYGVVIHLEPVKEIKGLIYQNEIFVGEIKPGETKYRVISLKAKEDILTSQAKFKIIAKESKGFDADPVIIAFKTRELTLPKLSLVDKRVEDFNENAKIEPLEMVKVIARIQNIGHGQAKGVECKLIFGENVFLALGSKDTFNLGSFAPGEYKDISFFFYTNKRIKSGERIPISIEIKEGRGRFYGKEDLNLVMYAPQKRVKEVVVAAKKGKHVIEITEGLSIDVDTKIPKGEPLFGGMYDVAVIIANKDYENAPEVEFAFHDGAIMKEYLLNTLGFRKENIIYKQNATLSELNLIFGTEKHPKGKIYNYVKKDVSKVFIYYVGHGAPDPKGEKAYIIPVDANPDSVTTTGYSFDILKKNLAKMPAKDITLVVDSCFSGRSAAGMLFRDRNPLIGILIAKDIHSIPKEKNITMLLSAKENQTSTWYRQKRHSLFTYFFLKALQGDADKNRDNEITIMEIEEYLMENVPYWARRLNYTEQEPVIVGKKDKVLAKLK